MEALPIVGFALAIGVIVVVMAIRSTRNSRTLATRNGDGSYMWFGGDSGGSGDCNDGGSSSGGGDCGGGDGGGGGD
jgi:hypothetical protein